MPKLPILTDGYWRKIEGRSNRPHSIVHVKWSFDPSLLCFPFYWRTKNGGVYYPPFGEGWYHKSEVDAAFKALDEGKLSTDSYEGRLEAIESWEFGPYHKGTPFTFVHYFYELRQLWKSQKNPFHKILKVVLNCFYGKTVQKFGWKSDNDGTFIPPSFHNMGYAGSITADVRSQMFEAVMQNPEAVVLIVSDGLYTTEELDLPIGDDMGQYSKDEHDGIVVISTAKFWILDKCDQPSEREQLDHPGKFWKHEGQWYRTTTHSQGLDKGALTIDMVLDAWKKRSETPDTLIFRMAVNDWMKRSGIDESSFDTVRADFRRGKILINEDGLSLNTVRKEWRDKFETVEVPATRFMSLGSVMKREGKDVTINEELWPFWRTWRTIQRPIRVYSDVKRSPMGDIKDIHPEKGLRKTLAAIADNSSGDMSSKYILPNDDESEEEFPEIDGSDQQTFEKEVEEGTL
jgi:hypothetical protein